MAEKQKGWAKALSIANRQEAGFSRRAHRRRLILPVSLPGLTGQPSIHSSCVLDRPVKPGDDTLCFFSGAEAYSFTAPVIAAT